MFGIDLSGVERGLGDLNSDGATGQSAGNLVRSLAPSVQLLPDSQEANRLAATTQAIVTELAWNDRGQLVRFIDAEGNVSTYDYFPENDPDGDALLTTSPHVVLTDDASGYLRSTSADSEVSSRRTAAQAPAMIESQYGYDPVGNLVSWRNPRGVVFEYEVNQLNEVVKATRATDVSFAFDTGQLLENEAPLGYQTIVTYDFNGRVAEFDVENRDSNTPGVGDFVDRAYSYDILNNLLTWSVEVDATTVVTTEYRYDANQLLTQVQLPEGNQQVTSHDERNLPFRVTRGAGTAEAATVQYDYDLNGNLARFVDAEDHDGDGVGESTIWRYDGFDRQTEQIDPLGNRRLLVFDPASNVTRQQFFGHPAGQPDEEVVLLSDTWLTQDELNRVIQVDAALFLADGFAPTRAPDLRDGDSDGFVTTRIEYDALSRQTFVVEDDGESSQWTYDGAHRVVEVRDAVGNRRTMAYDKNSNPTEIRSFEVSTDGVVPEEEYGGFLVWDQLDRLVRESGDHTIRRSYDSRDNLITVSDAQGAMVRDSLNFYPGTTNEPGNTTTYQYDGRDLLTQQLADLRMEGQGGQELDVSNPFNPDGQISLSYEFDGNSRLVGIVDDNQNATSYAYDALDRMTGMVNADGTTYQLQYDRDSNVVELTDPGGNVVTQVFDALNRVVRRDIAAATGVIGTTVETYEYDGLSRLTQASDNNGRVDASAMVQNTFDSLSRVLEEQQGAGTSSSVWSGDGRRLALTYPGSDVVSFGYDAIDRVETITNGAASVAEYAWIGPSHRPLSRSHQNGTSLSFLNGAGSEVDGYDGFRRVVDLEHEMDGVAFVDREYVYNRANQRVSEQRVEDGGLTDSYVYDSAYRVVESNYDQSGLAGAVPRDLQQTSYVLDGVGNRREVTTTRATSGASTVSYSVNEVNEYTQIGSQGREHDADGNLVSTANFDFHFDYKDRLVEARRASDGALVARYGYDIYNRRVAKTVFDPDNAGSVIKETFYVYDGFQVVEERGPSGTEVRYVYGAGLDEPIQMVRTDLAPGGAGTFTFHQNARGDVVAITDAAGAVVERFVYDDFGRPDHVSDEGNPYLFQGRRYDSETGLYYFRNRYYDPETGRFIQRDPVWDPANVGNQYTFGANSPTTNSDPMGTEVIDFVSGYLDLVIGFYDIAAEPVNLLRDAFGSVTGTTDWNGPIDMYEDWVSGDNMRRASNFNSMLGQGMEQRYVYQGQGAVETVAKTTAEAAVMVYPPTAIALSGYGVVTSAADGDWRNTGRSLGALGMSGVMARQHYKETGMIFRVPRNARAARAPRDVDPAVAREMREYGIDADTPLYRWTERRFLNESSMQAEANANSCARILDGYGDTCRAIDAADLSSPGLNVTLKQGNAYSDGGRAQIAIRLGDVLEQGGRIYPDIMAAAQGLRPIYLTLPRGSVPFTFAGSPMAGAPTLGMSPVIGSTVGVRINELADLILSSVIPDAAQQNTEVEIGLTIDNFGPNVAEDVFIVVLVQDGWSLNGDSLGICEAHPAGHPQGPGATCSVGELGINGTLDFNLDLNTGDVLGEETIRIFIDSPTPDPDPANNQLEEGVFIFEEENDLFFFIDQEGTAKRGEESRHFFEIRSLAGSAPAENPVLRVNEQEGFSFSIETAGRSIVCNRGVCPLPFDLDVGSFLLGDFVIDSEFEAPLGVATFHLELLSDAYDQTPNEIDLLFNVRPDAFLLDLLVTDESDVAVPDAQVRVSDAMGRHDAFGTTDASGQVQVQWFESLDDLLIFSVSENFALQGFDRCSVSDLAACTVTVDLIQDFDRSNSGGAFEGLPPASHAFGQMSPCFGLCDPDSLGLANDDAMVAGGLFGQYFNNSLGERFYEVLFNDASLFPPSPPMSILLDGTGSELVLDARTPNQVAVVPNLRFPGTNGNPFAAVDVNVGSDNIAAIFDGFIEITQGGEYTFTSNSDDGAKLFIDDVLIVADNSFHGPRDVEAPVFLEPGIYSLKYAWFEGGFGAGLTVSYRGPDTDDQKMIIPTDVLRTDDGQPGLMGRFYDLAQHPGLVVGPGTLQTLLGPLNAEFLMPFATGRSIGNIDFGRGTENAPGDGSILDRQGTGGNLFGGIGVDVGLDNIGAYWTGYIEVPEDAIYRFTTRSDDGSVVYINDQIVVNNNTNQGMTNRSGEVELPAGMNEIDVAYFDSQFSAGFQLSWEQVTDEIFSRRIVPPEVLYRDETDSGIRFTPLVPGEAARVDVEAHTGGLNAWVNGWLDLNQDNQFTAEEQLIHDWTVNSGSNSFTFDVPSDALGGDVKARFRISALPGDNPAGLGAFGEVEDILGLVEPAVAPPTVSSLVPTDSGFDVQFSAPMDANQLNLYATGELGPTDVVVEGPSGPVAGSLSLGTELDSATFLKTGGPLEPGTYSVTLRSGADAFQSVDGILLDGDGDGVPGGDYLGSFVILAPRGDFITISVPDFVRGPGQDVNLPPDQSFGFPLTIEETVDAIIRKIDLEFSYDPTLLRITDVTLADDIGAATLDFVNNQEAGLLSIDILGEGPLGAGSDDSPWEFVSLVTEVPSSAGYGEAQILDLGEVTITDGGDITYPLIVDDGLHQVSYLGDPTGNGRINASDASAVAQLAALLINGFTSLPLINPFILADISGNGRTNARDASLIAGFAALINTPQIPPLPTAAPGFAPPEDLDERLAAGAALVLPQKKGRTELGAAANPDGYEAEQLLPVPTIDRSFPDKSSRGDSPGESWQALEDAIDEFFSEFAGDLAAESKGAM